MQTDRSKTKPVLEEEQMKWTVDVVSSLEQVERH